jgi:hypothetical protein
VVRRGAARRERDRGFGRGASGIGSSLSGMPFRGAWFPPGLQGRGETATDLIWKWVNPDLKSALFFKASLGKLLSVKKMDPC